MSPTLVLRYSHTDNGNCRVMFNDDDRRVYCLQQTDYRAGLFDFFVCTDDGETSHPVPLSVVLHLPLPAPADGDESTLKAARKWLSASIANNHPQPVEIAMGELAGVVKRFPRETDAEYLRRVHSVLVRSSRALRLANEVATTHRLVSLDQNPKGWLDILAFACADYKQ